VNDGKPPRKGPRSPPASVKPSARLVRVVDTTPNPPSLDLRAAWRRLRVWLPRVRLLWLLLAVLGGYGVYFLGMGLGIASLVALPLAALVTDLAFQRVRFDAIRVPDAALATGFFLALVFPPAVPLVGAVGVTIFAIAVRHALRLRARPWFNPAALGIVLGIVAFGFAPAWWGSISEPLVLAAGALLILWEVRSWRIPVAFLLAYAGFAILERVIVAANAGGHLGLSVLLLSAVDPAVLFFGLLMVTEPRTAPTLPPLQTVYAVIVAVLAALLAFVLPTLAVLAALLLGNLIAVGFRAWPAREPSPSGSRAGARRGRTVAAPAPSLRWSIGRRVAAGLLALVLVSVLAAATIPPGTAPTPLVRTSNPAGPVGSPVTGTSACATDNASIPAATLSALHKTLGPSTILSYSSSTGVVVFYDPVNQATVTETDLYEDFGYAEFNSDDYATSGCAPP
jgi:Na+-translocating ferredoxin:NAD+ oxidoreductase RnfD subunit